jgi:oligosaccharide repeat unit polymerase
LLKWRIRRPRANEPGSARVTAVEWLLAGASVFIAVLGYETRNYVSLAWATQALAGLSFVLLLMATRDVVRTGTIGKFCLMAGVFVFYWIDALALASQRYPFEVPEGFPYNATQFNQDLIHQALFYVTVFQLLLLIGYSIRPRFESPLRFFANRFDTFSFDRTLVAFLLIFCSFVPLFVYYNFEIDKVITALLSSRSGIEFETPERGLTQHVALFGIYGAALFFVYALKAATWRRLWWLALAVIAALPFILGGTRHIWLYISLPSVLIVLHGFKGLFTHKRVVALTTVALVVLVVAQAQFVFRNVGWQRWSDVSADEFSQVNTNGQLTALLFAEHLVPGQHGYFKELAEPYFIIHWIPRQVWPNKPIMESWTYYNEAYVEGGAFNVTPSVIGQFHLNWGLPGVIVIGLWLGFLTMFADRFLRRLDPQRQTATFVVVGMFYAFIISSFRFYSPVYFSYFFFGLLAMFLLTRRRKVASGCAETVAAARLATLLLSQ